MTLIRLTAAAALVIAAAPLAAQTTRFEGVVTDTLGHPVPDVRVRIVRTSSAEAVTDSLGEFRIVNLAPGEVVVSVRRLGYRPGDFVVTLPDDSVRVVTIVLTPITLAVDPINVRAAPEYIGLDVLGFNERRSHNFSDATFLGPDDIDARHAGRASDLLRQVPGITLASSSGTAKPIGHIPRECIMNIWIDGHFVNDMIYPPGDRGISGGFNQGIDALVGAHEVMAVEIYPTPSSVPPQFYNMNGTCGSIVIWTR